VEATPVPVSIHDGIDETDIGNMRELWIFAGTTRLDLVGRSCGCHPGGYESEENGELHVEKMADKKQPRAGGVRDGIGAEGIDEMLGKRG
jgi:hypothetical protein